MNNEGYELGWDSTIADTSPEFVLLPEGDYNFTVTNYERVRYAGGEKLPPCWKAVIHIQIQGKDGIAVIKHNLYLHSTTQGLLFAFFAGIGGQYTPEGEIRMDWNAVIGSSGRCKVGIRKWTGNDGNEHESNEIKKFYKPEGKPAKGFQAGKF